MYLPLFASRYKWTIGLGLFYLLGASYPAWGLDTLETPPPWGPVPTATPCSDPAACTPTPSATPSPTTDVIPLPTPTASVPAPSPTPTATPGVFTGRLELVYQFDKHISEGRKTIVKLGLVNVEQVASEQFPLKGVIRFEEHGYDMNLYKREVTFLLDQTGRIGVPIVFQSPGKKVLTIQLNYPGVASRHIGLYAVPFKATIFPIAAQTQALLKNPQHWHIWVNLYHSYTPHQQQRQYYLITYKGEVIQKLLTSSAGAGHVTPLGKFKLGLKLENPKSTRYDSFMPFWTTISIQGLDYGNHGLLGDSYLYTLGLPASHGCLRLSNKVVQGSVNIGGAKWVYSYVPVGTPIHIFQRPSPAFAFEDYRQWLQR